MSSMTRRDFVRNSALFGAALGAVPSLVSSLVSQQAAVPAPSNFGDVDPELVPALKKVTTLVFNPQTLAAVRKMPNPPLPPPPAPQPTVRVIPGPKGAPDVRVLVFDPSPGEKGRGAFLHIHGGGYIAGSAEQYGFIAQHVAQHCDCVAVSVDYRLAPETKFPGSLEDNYAALRWSYQHADELGFDRKRIAIGGESAGGGHAAMLAIAARDRGEIPVAFQMLMYPMLDDRTGSTQRVPPHIGTFIWTAESNRFGWTSLLGVPAGSAKVPYGSVPARVDNLSGLPPAIIVTGGIDLFMNEDIEYARRLTDARVPTELHVVPGGYHAFNFIAPEASVSKRFDDYWLSSLKRVLHP